MPRSIASPAQVAQAPQRPNMRYVLGTAEETGLEAQSCDAVTVATAFHWFDAPRFYAEAARILKPGGTLAIWSYGTVFIRSSAAAAALFDGLWRSLTPFASERLAIVLNEYRGLEPPEPLFRAGERLKMGMLREWGSEQIVRLARSWSPYVSMLEAKGIALGSPEDPTSTLQAQLDSIAAAEGRSTFTLEFPLTLLLATRA